MIISDAASFKAFPAASRRSGGALEQKKRTLADMYAAKSARRRLEPLELPSSSELTPARVLRMA